MSTKKTSLKRRKSSVVPKLSVDNGPTPVKVRRSSVSDIVLEAPLPKPSLEPASVLVFGEGVAGQLGLGEDETDRSKPATVPGLDSVIDVVAGGMHTVCLTSDQTVITFGCNDEGALGRDTSEEGSEYNPGKVEIPASSDTKVVQISAGDSHTAALMDDGSVYFWGSFRDSHGMMGLRSEGAIEKTPVKLGTDLKMVRIASGSHHLVMLSASGQVYTCGCGEQGQLGRVSERSSTRDNRHGMDNLLLPLPIMLSPRLKKITFSDIWTGSFCTFAKEKLKGDIYVFGLNNYRQIGLDEAGVHFWPALSKGLGSKWSKVSGGEHHTILLDNEGSVFTMGRKEYGRLGLGPDAPDADLPTVVPELSKKKFTDVTCGSFATFAVSEDGILYSWGMGSSQLGLGEEEDVYVPRQVKGKQLEGRKVVRVSSGGQHTVILATPKPAT